MAAPDYDALVERLTDRYGDALRWVAAFDARTFSYDVEFVRDDLRTELSGLDFETIVHRTMAVFNRRHVEDVYFHLGAAQTLLVEHESATAIHLYLDERRGVVVKVEAGETVSIPEFRESCLDALE